MRECILDSPRKILCVPKLEEDQRIVVEVITNPRSSRSNHWFAQGEVLENPSRSIDLREGIAVVGNDSHIAVFDFSDQLLQASSVPDNAHNPAGPWLRALSITLFQKRGLAAVDPEFRRRNGPSDRPERIDGEIQTVSFDQ